MERNGVRPPPLYLFAKGGLMRMVAQVAYTQLTSIMVANSSQAVMRFPHPPHVSAQLNRGFKRKTEAVWEAVCYQRPGRSSDMSASLSLDSGIWSNSATLLWTLYEYQKGYQKMTDCISDWPPWKNTNRPTMEPHMRHAWKELDARITSEGHKKANWAWRMR
jgi:hypothetical protein